MDLFGVGLPEAGLVFVLALILIGPQRFPEMARQAGRWYRTARQFTDAIMVDVRAAVDEIESEIADKNDGVRPIRELQDLRREFTQIGEEIAAAAGDEAAAARLANAAVEGTPEASATETPQQETPQHETADGERPASTGTGGL